MSLHQSLTCVGDAGSVHRQLPGLESERSTFRRSGFLLSGLEDVQGQHVARPNLATPFLSAIALGLHPPWAPVEGVGLFQLPLSRASEMGALEGVLRNRGPAFSADPVSSSEVVPDFFP